MNADAASSSEVLIPYIPYPLNPETGVPVKTALVSVEKRSDMRLNGKMICSKTGLPAPILGMTIHPETSKRFMKSTQVDSLLVHLLNIFVSI